MSAKRKIPKPVVTLVLRNNTADALPVQLFRSPNPMDISNVGTVYTWNITGVSFLNPAVSITVWPTGSVLLSDTFTGTANNVTDLVNFLNSLGVGSFWISESGGSTFIKTASAINVFGNLTIGIATTTVTWQNTSGAGGTLVLNVNAVPVVNNTTPPNASGSFSVSDGDILDGTYTAAFMHTIDITRTLLHPPFTTETVLNTSAVGIIVIPAIVIDGNYSYDIKATV